MIVVGGGRIYAYDDALGRFVQHASMLVDGDRIVALDTHPVGVAVDTIDLAGATVVPGFYDCHVHLAETGFCVGEASLAHVRSQRAFIDAIAALRADDGIVYAAGYDDATWRDGGADALPLERFHSAHAALVVRVDGHQSLANRTLMHALDFAGDVSGIERDAAGEPSGRLTLEANWRAQAHVASRRSSASILAAERRAIAHAVSRGVVALHAQLLGGTRQSYADDVARLGAYAVQVYPKICEPDATFAEELGLPTIGGDVFLDGSLGSCTAALRAPYRASETMGTLRFTDDEVYAYFYGAEARGIAAGVHAIGDAAIDQASRMWERVLAGAPSRDRAPHFIEHCEMPDDTHLATFARLGIALSVQPSFAQTWGGDGGMYDDRVGIARRTRMNPLRRMRERGILTCGGSDSPVCPLDPLVGMQAAHAGQEVGEQLDAHEALALYTVDAARLTPNGARGNLLPEMRADFVVLDGDPLEAGFDATRVLQTWIGGVRA